MKTIVCIVLMAAHIGLGFRLLELRHMFLAGISFAFVLVMYEMYARTRAKEEA